MTAINCRNKPKTFGINRIVLSKTTWKYPTVQHAGEYQEFDETTQIPDQKCYFMVIAMPIFGPVIDPGQDMHGVEVNEPPDLSETMATGLFPVIQWEGSVVSDAFGPPVARPSTAPIETIDEDNDEGQTMQSKGKGKGKEKSVGPQPSSVSTMEHPNLSTAGLEKIKLTK